MATSPGMSMEQAFELLAKMNESNQKGFLEAIKELKKPTEQEQKKIDEENARTLQRVKSAALQAKMAEEQRERIAKTCPHGTYHPGTGAFTHQFRAQIHSPFGEKPYFQPRCTQCGTTVKGKIYATPDQMQNGINLDQYKGIDLARLQAWADQSAQAA